eukprot:1247288-Pyramimonas_sp.AAC.1
MPDVDAKCPRCGQATEDDFHRTWECEGNQGNPILQGTNYLLPEAYAQRDMYERFWTRGLMPSAWTA